MHPIYKRFQSPGPGLWRSGAALWLALAIASAPAGGSGFSVSESPQRGAEATADRQALDRLRLELREAWRQRDIETLLMLLDEEIVVLPPGEEALEGRALLGAWAEPRMGTTSWFGPGIEAEIEIGVDLAFVVSLAKEGGLVTYRRGADGRWRLLRLVWTGAQAEIRTEAPTGEPGP